MIKITKVNNDEFELYDDMEVKVKQTGHITEIKTTLGAKAEQRIQKIDADTYVVLETGELKEFNHTENRIENATSLRQSMKNLRDIINTNCTVADRCKFITLTYKENMTDSKRLYEDIKKFHMRLRYNLDQKFEYITCIEPQARGAYHAHEILIFSGKAPYIPNTKIAEIWGHGFTKTTKIDSIDNIGAYLTAYLCNLPVEQSDIKILKAAKATDLKEVEAVDTDGNKIKKAVIKGARLKFYPKGFRFYRCSRGIKRPEIQVCTYAKARKMVGNAPLVYEKTIELSNENGLINKINYRQYNSSRKPKGAENED